MWFIAINLWAILELSEPYTFQIVPYYVPRFYVYPWYSVTSSSPATTDADVGLANRLINFKDDDSGEKCDLDSGESGYCERLETCLEAQDGIWRGRLPKICSFEGTMAVVCCKAKEEPEISVEDRVDDCPPIPAWAYNFQNRTGRKAFDKCLDYMDPLFPCVDAPAGSGSRYVRADWDTCGSPSQFPVIIGGKNAARDEYPHMAALGFGDVLSSAAWRCGATLVSEDFVLTAGHCVYDPSDGDVRFVRLGDVDIGLDPNPENVYSVSQIITHPEYKSPSKYNDIALIKLDRRVIFDANVRPACLNMNEEVTGTVLATGWGATEIAGDASSTLMAVTLDVFPTPECTRFHPIQRNLQYGVQDNLQICAGHYKDSKDTCQGDSGGPIQRKKAGFYCMYEIVGITSFGKACGIPGVPAVYTRVSAYVPWIESIIWPQN